MIDRPTILRGRVSLALGAIHPKSMDVCQLQQMVLASTVPAAYLRDQLGKMVEDGLLVEVLISRAFPREPTRAFRASDALASGVKRGAA